MISSFYHSVFYNPLYNGLVFLLSILPSWAGVGIAIILFTSLIRLILFPLARKSIHTQIRMKELQPKIDALRLRFKDKPQELYAETSKLYREYHLNPFSGILLVLIQFPIIIALYSIFRTGGLPVINVGILYPFVHAPMVAINMHFLGMDIGAKSLILALVAGISQYFQVKFSIPAIKVEEGAAKKTLKDDLMRSMNVQMRYVLPAFVFFVAYSINGAAALYWTTSNVFAIGQEIFVRRKLLDKTHDHLKPSLVIK